MLHGIHALLAPLGPVVARIAEMIVLAVCGLVVGVLLLIGRMRGATPSCSEGGESSAKVS